MCGSRTAGLTARFMVARSPLLSAGTIPHPVLPALPTISTDRPPTTTVASAPHALTRGTERAASRTPAPAQGGTMTTRSGRRGTPILDGAETAVAAARAEVRTAAPSALHRALTQMFTPSPDFPSPLAHKPHPAHTGRPDSLPSPLPLSARPQPSEPSKDAPPGASRVLASPAFNHATPYPARATPPSADACGPDGRRPAHPHRHKEEPC